MIFLFISFIFVFILRNKLLSYFFDKSTASVRLPLKPLISFETLFAKGIHNLSKQAIPNTSKANYLSFEQIAEFPS